jgi:glycosyltransferase involved in cell wall biosynthesis
MDPLEFRERKKRMELYEGRKTVESFRVLHVVTQMNRAGLENRLMDLYRHIDRASVQFDFYTCSSSKGYYDEEILALGGKVYYSSKLSIRYAHKTPYRFAQFLLNHPEYKIVHCHLNQWCGLVLKGAHMAGVPIRIAHSRTALEKVSLKNCVKNVIKTSVNKYCTHKMSVSEKAGVWLFGKSSVNKGEVYILPNAIDVKKFRFDPNIRKLYRETLGLGDATLVVIHVGNLRPEKNHKYLVDVFAALKALQMDSKLVLVGADYMNGEIHRYVQKRKLERDVIILGSRSDVSSLLQAGDVFVFPSFYEGFPGAVLEAQASGLPCVISDRITREVCVTDKVTRLSIKSKPEVWANTVLEHYQRFGPDRNSNDLRDSRYDVTSSVRELFDYYCDTIAKIGERGVSR